MKKKLHIRFSFGKNGLGITDELEKIGKYITLLSKKYNVYLANPMFDTLDDVYDFDIVCSLKDVNEGAWGYGAYDNDTSCDLCWDICKFIVDKIVKDMKSAKGMKLYAYMANCVELIKSSIFQRGLVFHEELDGSGDVFANAFNDAYENISNDDEFINSWNSAKAFRNCLEHMHDVFNTYVEMCKNDCFE